MPVGVIIAFLAYASFSVADALIKVIGPTMSVFEIGFFTTAFSIVPAIVANRHERWRDMYKLRHPWLVHLRCATAFTGSALVMYGFTHIPFTDVYAIAFTTPIFVTALSVLILKEKVSGLRWLLLLISFLGVVLVIRPGFRSLEPGHFAIMCSACLGAITTIVLRHIAPHERRVSLVGILVLYSVILNAILMFPVFVTPTWEQMGIFALIGTMGGTGAILLIAATRRVPANRIAPVHYSQLIWGIVFGAAFFGELPDYIAIIGLMIVLAAGLANVMSERLTINWKPRMFFFRSGL